MLFEASRHYGEVLLGPTVLDTTTGLMDPLSPSIIIQILLTGFHAFFVAC